MRHQSPVSHVAPHLPPRLAPPFAPRLASHPVPHPGSHPVSRLVLHLLLLLALFVGLVMAGLAVAPRAAGALPTYSLRQGLPCVACHFDPNGGGGRREMGFIFARNRHDMAPEDRWQDIVLSNKVGDALYFGTDLRQQYTYVRVTGSGETGVSTFWPMQGAFYVTFAPFEKLVVTYNRDLRQARDAWGMVRGLPAGLYVKAGQFRLPFGLRQDDHTSALRAGYLNGDTGGFGTTGFLPYDPRNVEGGVEVGVSPLEVTNLTLVGAVSNGGAPFENKAQCVTAQLYYNEDRHLGGVSFYDNWVSSTGNRDVRWSLYAGIALTPRLQLLGEVGTGTSDEGPDSERRTRAFFVSGDYKLSRTVLLRAKYDYLDLNDRVEGQASERFVAETDLTPLPFCEFKLSWRYIRPENTNDQNQILAQAHFSY